MYSGLPTLFALSRQTFLIISCGKKGSFLAVSVPNVFFFPTAWSKSAQVSTQMIHFTLIIAHLSNIDFQYMKYVQYNRN